MPDTIFCPNCGERISARARFCVSCGARQEEFRVAPEPPPPPSTGGWAAGGPPAPPPPPPATPTPDRSRPAAAKPPPRDETPSPAPPHPPQPPPPADPPPAAAKPPPAAPPVADDPPPAAAKPPTDPPREQAAELAGLLRERLALPGIVAAAIAAAVSAVIVLVAGVVIAVVTPDSSIIGSVGVDASLVTESFRQAVGTLLTAMVDEPGLLVSGTRRIHPLLLLAIPLGALIVTTRSQLYRTEGATPVARLGWAALVGVPFGLLMLAFAIVGGDSDTTRISTSPGGAFALGVVWGALGGLIGAATKLPLADVVARIPPAPRSVLAAALATLRPLAVVLAVCTVVGLAGWLVQVGRDAGGVRAGRSAPTALIEEAVFVGEHGINLTALAAGARFTADADGPLGLPFPVEDAEQVPARSGAFRIFSYEDALPAFVFLPALVLLIGLVALGALYAGFAAARASAATSLQSGALWGAITGPAWAIAMALLVVGAGGLFHGDADDTSVFGIFLLGGALLGATGGALAVSGQAPPASSSSS